MLGLLMGLMMTTPSPSVLSVPHELLVIPDPIEKEWTQDEVKSFASSTAVKYGLNKTRFLEVIRCENKFYPTGQSQHYYKGIREDSWGAVQINLYWNPEVTREQAEDPEFAIEWMAKKWSTGKAHLWSCWRTLYGS